MAGQINMTAAPLRSSPSLGKVLYVMTIGRDGPSRRGTFLEFEASRW